MLSGSLPRAARAGASPLSRALSPGPPLSRIVRGDHAYPTMSQVLKKKAISVAAVSGASEP